MADVIEAMEEIISDMDKNSLEELSDREMVQLAHRLHRGKHFKRDEVARAIGVDRSELNEMIKKGDEISRKKKEILSSNIRAPPPSNEIDEVEEIPAFETPEERSFSIARKLLDGSNLDKSVKNIVLEWIRFEPNSVNPQPFKQLLLANGVTQRVAEILASRLHFMLEMERRKDEFFDQFLRSIQVPRYDGQGSQLYGQHYSQPPYSPYMNQMLPQPAMNPVANPFNQYAPLPPPPAFPVYNEYGQAIQRSEVTKDDLFRIKEDVMNMFRELEEKEQRKRKAEEEEQEKRMMLDAIKSTADAVKKMNEELSRVKRNLETKNRPVVKEEDDLDKFAKFINIVNESKKSAAEELSPVLRELADAVKGSRSNPIGTIRSKEDLELAKFGIDLQKRELELQNQYRTVMDALDRAAQIAQDIGQGIGKGIATASMKQATPQQVWVEDNLIKGICPNCGTTFEAKSDTTRIVCDNCKSVIWEDRTKKVKQPQETTQKIKPILPQEKPQEAQKESVKSKKSKKVKVEKKRKDADADKEVIPSVIISPGRMLDEKEGEAEQST